MDVIPGASELADLFGRIQFAMLTTCDREGQLVGRPVQTLRFDSNHVFWFFTSARSAKIQQLQSNAHVNLAYADPQRKIFVSVSGVAELLRDEHLARDLWQLSQTIFFPLGPADPDLVILKVHARVAQYWNGNASLLETAIKFGNAALRGERADLGTVAEIPLRPDSTAAEQQHEPDV